MITDIMMKKIWNGQKRGWI